MNNSESLEPLMSDREIANLLDMSESWVRQQRSNRLHGRKHALAVDPVYLNDSPRYRRADIAAWFAGLATPKTYPVAAFGAGSEGIEHFENLNPLAEEQVL